MGFDCFLEQLAQAGLERLSDVAEEDRDRFEFPWLFHLLLLYMPELDQAIHQEQQKLGMKSRSSYRGASRKTALPIQEDLIMVSLS